MENRNLDMFNGLRDVPVEHLSRIKGGSLDGMLNINPVFRYEALTKLFGPCGTGWWFDTEAVEPSNTNMVTIKVSIYYRTSTGEVAHPVVGYGSASRWADYQSRTPDTDCYAKAETDAFGKAAKKLGMAADVYYGKYNDVVLPGENVEQEENPTPAPVEEKVTAPAQVAATNPVPVPAPTPASVPMKEELPFEVGTQENEVPTPKKRGRRKKEEIPVETPAESASEESPIVTEEIPAESVATEARVEETPVVGEEAPAEPITSEDVPVPTDEEAPAPAEAEEESPIVADEVTETIEDDSAYEEALKYVFNNPQTSLTYGMSIKGYLEKKKLEGSPLKNSITVLMIMVVKDPDCRKSVEIVVKRLMNELDDKTKAEIANRYGF